MDAATASAGIAAVSAAISAVGAWNARRSALASQSSLRETSRQQVVDNARQTLGDLGRVYDDAMAMIESLARDLQHNPVRVERCREALRRSILVAGISIPSLQNLIDATSPRKPEDIAQLRQDLQNRSTSLHALTLDMTSHELGPPNASS
jgi:hypothetical protein